MPADVLSRSERLNRPAVGRRQRRLFAPAPRRPDFLPYALLLPSLVVICLVEVYPFLTGFYYSLHEGSLLRTRGFVGLENYRQLWGMNDFRHALYFSGLFAVTSVVGSYLLGLGLALLLNDDVPGRGFFRVALLLPWITPSVVSIVSWRWMIADQYGLVNVVLGWLGTGPVFFLSSNDWAMFSVIAIRIWRSFPFMMISCLAALQSIDRDLYEAAAIDGAGRRQSFLHITLPQIKTVSIILGILMTIWTVNDFDTPWLLTEGGPAHATENLSILAYLYTFARSDVGIGSAISFVTLVILMVFVVLLLRERREDTERG